MRILDLKRRPDGSMECRLEDATGEIRFGIDPLIEGPLLGFNFKDVSTEEKFRIYDAKERRELFQQIFRFIRGEHVDLPMTVRAVDSTPSVVDAKAAG